MNLKGEDYRDVEIDKHFRNITIISCVGTKVRAWGDEVYRVVNYEHHTGIIFGWRRSAMVNFSCGITFMVGKRFRATHIAVLLVPADLHGRAAAIRISQGEFQVCAIALYLPPLCTKSGMAIYRRTVRLLLQWLGKLLAELPTRVTPLLYMDANTDVEPCGENDPIVGSRYKTPHEIGKQLYSTLQAGKLSLVNTFFDGGNTFAQRQGKSRIDFLGIPQTNMGNVINCWTLRRTARAIRASSYVDDHYPLLMKLYVPWRHRLLVVRPLSLRD